MNLSGITGILIGILAILGAFLFEGGSLVSIMQPKAALIVLGGTLGAGIINFPMSVLINAVNELKNLLFENELDFDGVISDISEIAGIVRQEGVLVLQKLIPSIKDPFLRKGLILGINTNDRNILEEIFDSEIKMEEEKGLIVPIFFEALGGYAPTFGIIGAVLGLIQALSSIENPTILGHGISIAFVATFYGVGVANLIFLPIAGRLRYRLREKILYKQLINQGILCIHKGENPFIVKEKLLNYV